MSSNRIRFRLFAALFVVLAWQPPLRAQTASDSAAVRQTSLDYIEGWYTGNADRMAGALHPDLAKRIVNTAPGGQSGLSNMGAPELIATTRGKPAGPVGRDEVRILDMFGNTASVRVDPQNWVDYLHLARWNGEWRIVNVLWEMRR